MSYTVEHLWLGNMLKVFIQHFSRYFVGPSFSVAQALAEAGALAKRYGHRITFHPSEFCKIAGTREE